jgi:hypothetical protein
MKALFTRRAAVPEQRGGPCCGGRCAVEFNDLVGELDKALDVLADFVEVEEHLTFPALGEALHDLSHRARGLLLVVDAGTPVDTSKPTGPSRPRTAPADAGDGTGTYT